MTLPKSVDVAVKLIWAATAVSAVITVVMGIQMVRGRSDGLALASTLIVVFGLAFAGLWWLGLKLRQGRNWARAVYIALVVLSLFSAQDIPETFEVSIAKGFSSLGSLLLLVVTGGLLLVPSANKWFRESTSANRVA